MGNRRMRTTQFQLTHSRGVRLFGNIRFPKGIISTHALTWSATRLCHSCRNHCRFQLTHSRGVRPRSAQKHMKTKRFQLTHSRGVRLYVSQPMIAQYDFNSRTHVECDIISLPSFPWFQHFNSRTHVECDKWHAVLINPFDISTHALTWSATYNESTEPKQDGISTHALTWSATYCFVQTVGIK